MSSTPSSSSSSSFKVYPIRVDVTSDDKSIRIIDTLLVDPTCWPIPLYVPLHEAVEQNVRDFAHTILSDMEVQGMGRTVRHFAGRVDLWSTNLQSKLEDQLRPQLWMVVSAFSSSLPTTLVSNNNSNSSNSNNNNRKGPCIPIYIRLNTHGISISEDILWDPNLPYTPFDFASDMAKDLKLPEEATVAVAITIIEQLYGIATDASPDKSATTGLTNRTGAIMMDPKDVLSMTAHIVAQHRPT